MNLYTSLTLRYLKENKRTSFETYYMYDFKRGSFYDLNCQFKSDKLLMNH